MINDDERFRGLNVPEYTRSHGLMWLNELAKAKGIGMEDLANSSKMLAESWKKSKT